MKLTCTTIDADDVVAMAAFWSAALDREVVGEPDEGSVFLGTEGDPGRIYIQRTDDPKLEKNRVHFDFESADREGEVDRLLGLGATRHADHETGGAQWTVLADVEGNQFCVF